MCYSLNTFSGAAYVPAAAPSSARGEFHASNATFKPLDFHETLNNIWSGYRAYSAAALATSVKRRHRFNLEELPVFEPRLSRHCEPCVLRGSQRPQGTSGADGECHALIRLSATAVPMPCAKARNKLLSPWLPVPQPDATRTRQRSYFTRTNCQNH